MQYFHRRACGAVAVALLLSACGEETSIASSSTNQAIGERDSFISNSIRDAINEQQHQAAAGAPDQATPNVEFSAPATPSAASTTDLASGEAVILAEVPNVRIGARLPAQPRQPRNFNDTRPVEPAPPESAGNPPATPAPVEPPAPGAQDDDDLPAGIGGDPMVSLIATTESELNSTGTKLVWTSENVDQCEAQGAWDGPLASSGELALQHGEAGEKTYSIQCTGAAGTAMAMVTVEVASTALAWQPPASNTDGTPLTDLAGYNLYYGTAPGRYTNVRPVVDASQTDLQLPVEPGTYYLAMTAYDLSGNESELSNEIVRIIN